MAYCPVGKTHRCRRVPKMFPMILFHPSLRTVCRILLLCCKLNSDSDGKKNRLYVRTYLTERVKSPGLLLLGRARKLPWTPRVNRSCSASIPVMLGWNHLQSHEKQGTNKWPFKYQSDPHFRNSRKYSLQIVSPLPPNKAQTHNVWALFCRFSILMSLKT